MRFVTTLRPTRAAGGAAETCDAPPVTLVRTGAKAAMWETGARAISSRLTWTTLAATGRAFTNVSRDTAVTAPGTC